MIFPVIPVNPSRINQIPPDTNCLSPGGSTLNIDHLRQDIVFHASLRGRDMVFHSTWGLFSPRAIDEGTRLLIERMEVHPSDRCLDLGCGYGPIGLAMAMLAPAGTVYMVDKDFVAVEYAQKNAARNTLTNCKIFLSNGFSSIPPIEFDVIASNLPAKAGNELFYLMLTDAKERLAQGGRLYVVTISGLKDFIKRVFREIFGNYTKVKQGRAYTLALAVK